MSETRSASKRPLSPFMIGPYYKPQLTSILSITHRGTGVFLALGALLLAWWLYALAAGPDAYQQFSAISGNPVGKLVIAGLVFSLIYHLLNGIRHLLWDIGWGFELPRAYATGYAVIALAALGTAAALYCAFMGGAA